jgi:outer membrane protein TolC
VNFRFLILVAALALAGCSADSYVRDADRQVHGLLRDREDKTLGYEPKTEVSSEIPPPPAKKAYEKIPASPIPQEQNSRIEPAVVQLNYEPLGPPPQDELAPTIVRMQTEQMEQIQQNALDRLKLGPPAAGPAVIVLDLLKSLDYAAHNSRDYKSRMEDLYLAALDVTLRRHLFEPRPFANAGASYTGSQKDFGYESALNATAAAGLRQQLPYGGEVTAQALVRFVNALNDNTQSGESADLAISGSIPLLRGAGMVNLEPLIQSERQLVYEVRGFEEFRREFVVNVASSYFRLINTRQSIDNNLVSYINTISLTTRLQEMYAAGRPGYKFLQVQQSLSRQLSQENSVIQSSRDYQSALDDFKVQIGMPVEQEMDVVPQEMDVHVPDLQRLDVTDLALKYRLSLQTARDQVDDAKRKIEVAKNSLLPELDVNFNSSVGNPTESAAKNLNSSTWQYSAGVTLDLPVDRVAERNAFRSSLISFERARRNLEQQRDLAVSDVRQSVRSLQSAQSTLEIQRKAIDVARRQLDYANELLTQGQAQARDVTDALSSLLSAQTSYDRARADLQIQVLSFLRDTGTLRVDPASGALGHAIDLAMQPAIPTRVQDTGG